MLSADMTRRWLSAVGNSRWQSTLWSRRAWVARWATGTFAASAIRRAKGPWQPARKLDGERKFGVLLRVLMVLRKIGGPTLPPHLTPQTSGWGGGSPVGWGRVTHTTFDSSHQEAPATGQVGGPEELLVGSSSCGAPRHDGCRSGSGRTPDRPQVSPWWLRAIFLGWDSREPFCSN